MFNLFKNKKSLKDTSYVFFGTSEFSVHVLDVFYTQGFIPKLIVTVPDKPAGRKLVMTPPPVKTWAIEHNIPYVQFTKLDALAVQALEQKEVQVDTYIVASYGKIIPEQVLRIPTHGCLNIHPSLLPLLRGATPLQTSIMQDMQDTGVTIIQMDKEMDHGPIVAVHREHITPWPQVYPELETHLAQKGASLLLEHLPSYIDGTSIPTTQIHSDATYTKKIEKDDGLIQLDSLQGKDAWNMFLKYNALYPWPGLYFFAQKMNADGTSLNIRVKVKEAVWNTANSSVELTKVVPEGKKEMTWKDFLAYIG